MSESFGIRSAHGLDVLRVANKSQGKCIICGLPVNLAGQRHIDWNIEHYIPKAVAKWSDTSSSYALRELISRDANMFIAHPDCNRHKGIMYTEEGIDTLPVDEKHKELLHKLYDTVEEYAHSFKDTISSILKKQNNCCKLCKKQLGSEYTVRRIDWNASRSVDNGMVVCMDCNESMANNSYHDPLAWILR